MALQEQLPGLDQNLQQLLAGLDQLPPLGMHRLKKKHYSFLFESLESLYNLHQLDKHVKGFLMLKLFHHQNPITNL